MAVSADPCLRRDYSIPRTCASIRGMSIRNGSAQIGMSRAYSSCFTQNMKPISKLFLQVLFRVCQLGYSISQLDIRTFYIRSGYFMSELTGIAQFLSFVAIQTPSDRRINLRMFMLLLKFGISAVNFPFAIHVVAL